MLRRSLLVASLATGLAERAHAQPRPGPFRLGVDRALVESGLAARLVGAFGADTGLAVKVVAAPALTVLDAVRDGEVDAALVNAPDAEEKLAAQTLVHTRKAIATGEFVLVGPRPIADVAAPGDAASAAVRATSPGGTRATTVAGRDKPSSAAARAARPPATMRDIALALQRLHAAATAAPQGLVFASAGDGSGEHVVEQALWRAAGVDPTSAWYVKVDAGRGLVDAAKRKGAYAIVERGALAARGAAPLRIVAEGDPLLAEPVHAMLSFRSSHPAARLFIGWVGGRQGRAAAARVATYRAA